MRIAPLSLLLATALLAPAQAQETPQPPVQDAPAQSQPPAQQALPPQADEPIDDERGQAREQPEDLAPIDDPDAAESAASKVPLDEIQRFVAVYNAVREAYVDPVDDDRLMHSAVKGLLLDLDPHSTYFDKDDAQA